MSTLNKQFTNQDKLYEINYVVAKRNTISIDPCAGKKIIRIPAPNANSAIIRLIASLELGTELYQVNIELVSFLNADLNEEDEQVRYSKFIDESLRFAKQYGMSGPLPDSLPDVNALGKITNQDYDEGDDGDL